MLEKWIDVSVLSQKKCSVPIPCDLKYAGSDNFLGRPVAGYHEDAKDVGLMTRNTALALCETQNYLTRTRQMGLILFDAYRPSRAVRDFDLWMNSPPSGESEFARKLIHYPHLEKSQLASLGYMPSTESRHSFGNVVDVFLIDAKTGLPLDMGSVFDFFDKLSHPSAAAEAIGQDAFNNRTILIEAMKLYGFQVHDEEYWHFDYKEREVNKPMDFEITASLKGLNVT